MIDIESEVFLTVSNALFEHFTFLPGLVVLDEYVRAPSSFPCVTIVETDNQAYRNTRDSSCNENHAQLLYEVNVWSNLTNGKKAQCRELIGFVDEKMQELGFTRSFLNPIPNEADSTLYRITSRYRALVSKDHTIYRR